MSVETDASGSAGSGLTTAVLLFGWINLGILAAFIASNFMINGFGWPGVAVFSPAEGALSWVLLALYVGACAVATAYALSRRRVSLRVEAERVTAINNYLIRAAFWMVLIIGIVDITLSFLRVEGYLEIWFGTDVHRNLGLPRYRGLFVHVPLMLLSLVIAAFTRTLGFVWLALLIVVAELLIVFSRFLFSYEQAFMSDLVRFWYAALFLFASAYTLLEEGHVRVDVFYASFSQRRKGIVNAVGAVAMGIVFCWTILILGTASKAAIINAPVFNFEVSQSAGFGMFVKYLMAAFLAIFAISMMIQFVSSLFSSIADWRDEPGGVERQASAGH